MKKIFIIILMLLMTNGYSKDFHKTEEMINNILKEDGDSSVKKENTLIEEKNQPQDTSGNEQPGEEKKKEETQQADTEETAKKTPMSGNDEILLKTGIQLYESGMYDHALLRFNDIIKNFPASKFLDSARMWAGKIYLRKFDYDNALKEFNSVGEKSGEYPASLF